MGLVDFSISIILLTVAVCLGMWLGYLVVMPVLLLFRGKKTHKHAQASLNKIEKVDSLIAEEKYKQAIKKLRKMIIYGAVRNPAVIDALKAHHQNILSRCLIISEETGFRPSNLKEVEHLFMERAELQQLYIKALDSYRTFRMRRKSAGKAIPDWGKKDFEERLTEIKKELKRNETSLKKESDNLFSSLSSALKNQSITYH